MSESHDLSSWKELVDAAVDFASNYPEAVRGGIVQALLFSEGGRIAGGSLTPRVTERGEDSVPQNDGAQGLAAVAAAAGVDSGTLQRYVQLGADGGVTIKARVNATAKIDRQNLFSALTAYVRENAFGEYDSDAEVLRAVCDQNNCLDRNFAANLRSRDYLLEHGGKGAPKTYRLTPEGEAAARTEIRRLCGVET